MGESLFGAEMFNLDQALHYGSFSHRVWSVSSGMHPVDLNLFWLGKGPRFCGSDTWMLVPEDEHLLSLTYHWIPEE